MTKITKALGFDPGGAFGFGCAVLDASSKSCVTQTVSSVDDAVSWATSLGIVPDAAGIDTLLFWQSTRSGWRGADEFLRKTYPTAMRSVVASNGLYGSMAVQGAVLAHRLREQWPQLKLTETHPKVLWAHFYPDTPYPRDWAEDSAQCFLREHALQNAEIQDSHQLDALLSAWAAIQAFNGSWPIDLATTRAEGQVGENISVVSNVHYFWPG